jgi:3-phenylpropionate/trans-cinnamate dioxygenase ferredoxin subunit
MNASGHATAGADVRPVAQKFVVCEVNAIAAGDRFLTTVAGRELAVFRIEDEFFALLNRCPHQGGPLCLGGLLEPVHAERPGEYRYVAGVTLIECPWHGWEFDLRTGQSYFDPRRTRARFFPAERLTGEAIIHESEMVSHGLAEGIYRAETIPVSIEEEYVVVTMRMPEPAARGPRTS